MVTPLDLHDYPWSHSLAMSAVWSVLCAGLFWAGTHYGRGALVVALGVFSHWVLDFITHRPDMPLYPGSTRSVGLGLWNSLPATLAVEVSLFVVGVAIYARATRALRARGIVAFWLLVVVVSISYVGAIFGPPPPSVDMIKYVGLTSWLFVVWAWWIDRNRVMRASAPSRRRSLSPGGALVERGGDGRGGREGGARARRQHAASAAAMRDRRRSRGARRCARSR